MSGLAAGGDHVEQHLGAAGDVARALLIVDDLLKPGLCLRVIAGLVGCKPERFARRFDDLEMSNKALVRTAELALEVRQLKREIAALKQQKDEAQMSLLGSAA